MLTQPAAPAAASDDEDEHHAVIMAVLAANQKQAPAAASKAPSDESIAKLVDWLNATFPPAQPDNLALIAALKAIVVETTDHAFVQPYSADSYLPAHLIDAAVVALNAACAPQ